MIRARIGEAPDDEMAATSGVRSRMAGVMKSHSSMRVGDVDEDTRRFARIVEAPVRLEILLRAIGEDRAVKIGRPGSRAIQRQTAHVLAGRGIRPTALGE